MNDNHDHPFTVGKTDTGGERDTPSYTIDFLADAHYGAIEVHGRPDLRDLIIRLLNASPEALAATKRFNWIGLEVET